MFDALNAAFEFAGAVFSWSNVIALRTHKSVRGVYLPAQAFFAAWGYWNLLYYPALDQWWSALAAALLAVANTVWIAHAVHYWRAARHGSADER